MNLTVQMIDNVIQLAEDGDFAKLEKTLLGLNFEDIKYLQCLMYLGRDQEFVENIPESERLEAQKEYFDNNIGWKSQKIEIDQMLEKRNAIARYLKNGKKLCGL